MRSSRKSRQRGDQHASHRVPLFTLATLLAFWCIAGQGMAQTARVKPGIDVLRSRGFDGVRGKRVGLITNPSGVGADLRSTVDILASAPGVHLVALFGPEHGVRGDAPGGEIIASTVDQKTGVPVYSLYGRNHKPTPEMLAGVDVLVYDIQDIGVRSYTYIATLGQCMEAAADRGIPFVVLDRPNPLGGNRVEGTPVTKGFESMVSPYPIPYVYGLTPGELARLLNETGLLAGGRRCDLTVVPLEGWKRSMLFSETGLHWVPTSPHVPFPDGPLYTVATGVIGELQTVSVGIGYTLPFHLFGAPWIDGARLADTLAAMRIPGVLFRPMTYRPFYGSDQGKELHGVQIYLTAPEKADLLSIQFRLLEAHHKLYPDHDPFANNPRVATFDRVIGNDKIRAAFSQRFNYGDIQNLLSKGVEDFRTMAKKYWLYQ